MMAFSNTFSNASSNTYALSHESPWLARFGAYLAERFPPVGHGVLILSYYSSNQFLAERLSGMPLAYGLESLLGVLTVLLFFFHLRVFDEHKDYADDCRHHPQRVLQRGLVTLRDLRRLAFVAIALQAVFAVWVGPAAFIAWLIAFVFSLLMLKEFFLRRWLRQRFLLFAGSHMLVMPLLALVVFAFTTGSLVAGGWFWLYAFVGFFVTFNWEISRKIRAPEDERDGVDSYSKTFASSFGQYGAAWVVIAIRLIDTGLVIWLGRHLGLGLAFEIALILLFLVCLVGFVDYRFHTHSRTAKRLETYAGLYIVAFDVILAVALVRLHGLSFAGLEIAS